MWPYFKFYVGYILEKFNHCPRKNLTSIGHSENLNVGYILEKFNHCPRKNLTSIGHSENLKNFDRVKSLRQHFVTFSQNLSVSILGSFKINT